MVQGCAELTGVGVTSGADAAGIVTALVEHVNVVISGVVGRLEVLLYRADLAGAEVLSWTRLGLLNSRQRAVNFINRTDSIMWWVALSPTTSTTRHNALTCWLRRRAAYGRWSPVQTIGPRRRVY